MLCHACHVHTRKGFPFCLRCGSPLPGHDHTVTPPSMLYPADGGLGRDLAGPSTTIGRSRDNDVVVGDPFASRYHARIWREPAGYRLEDLDSLNGTFVNGERMAAGASRLLRDYDVVAFGPHAQLRIEQPRSTDIGGKTMVSAPGSTLVARASPAAADAVTPTALDLKPRRRSGWALKQVASTGTEARYVLRNTRTSAYLQLTGRDRFLWDLMDGDHRVRDLLFAYSREYGQLALPRIQQLIEQLSGAGLLALAPGKTEAGARTAKDRVVAALLRMELAVAGLDGGLERIYRSVGWIFFTPVGVGLVLGSAVVGLLLFATASGHARLFDVGGAGVVGGVLAFAAYTLSLVVHELAHALATKSFGRKVPRGGLMVMMGMPYAFVDTTDMWFEGRGPRIMVSLAGPIATAAMAAVFAAGAALLPDHVAAGVCFQVAFALYINTLFNFNPLIPLDGYYALSDWLEMPRLREEASGYFRKGLWRDIRAGRRPGAAQAGLAVFGMISVVGMIGFLLLGVFSWTSRLGPLVHAHVPPPLDTIILVTGLLLLFFPVWYFPVLKLSRRVRGQGRGEVSSVELETMPT